MFCFNDHFTENNKEMGLNLIFCIEHHKFHYHCDLTGMLFLFSVIVYEEIQDYFHGMS